MGSDTERIAALVSHLAQHWRGARVAIWLPLRDDGRAERMCARRVGPSTTRLVHRHGPPQRRLPDPLHHLSSATPAAPFLLHPPSAHTLAYLPAVAPVTTDASYCTPPPTPNPPARRACPLSYLSPVTRRYEQLRQIDAPGGILAAELAGADAADGRLAGSGLVLVQPHYGLDAELRELLPALGECLRRPGAEPAKARVRWIREST